MSPDDAGAHVLQHMFHEASHLPLIVLCGHCLKARFTRWLTIGIREAQRCFIKPSATINMSNGVCHWHTRCPVIHMSKAVDVVRYREVVHFGQHVIPQAQHAKVHLGSCLHIGHLILEEGYALEEGSAPSNVQDQAHVLCLIRTHVVVLTYVDRRVREGKHIVVKELGFQIGRGVGCVETVDPPLEVRSRDIVLGLVPITLGVQHSIVELRNLPERWRVTEARAGPTDCVGESCSEVQPRLHDTHLLLSFQHGIESTDDGLRHFDWTICNPSSGIRWHLQVWFIEDVHDFERSVVRLIHRKEPLLQIMHVRILDLREAVVLGVFPAIPWHHLVERVVTHARQHAKTFCMRFIKEGAVVIGRVVAVEAYYIGTQKLDVPQIRPASTPPHGHGLSAHPVILRQL
mmetsp:Transcript_18978/g.44608  ORF Transcript_18978/g.44608 Transcript_18978/m.44608 type:complete len:402 (-) Transcript_18978:177-1382(-)